MPTDDPTYFGVTREPSTLPTKAPTLDPTTASPTTVKPTTGSIIVIIPDETTTTASKDATVPISSSNPNPTADNVTAAGEEANNGLYVLIGILSGCVCLLCSAFIVSYYRRKRAGELHVKQHMEIKHVNTPSTKDIQLMHRKGDVEKENSLERMYDNGPMTPISTEGNKHEEQDLLGNTVEGGDLNDNGGYVEDNENSVEKMYDNENLVVTNVTNNDTPLPDTPYI